LWRRGSQRTHDRAAWMDAVSAYTWKAADMSAGDVSPGGRNPDSAEPLLRGKMILPLVLQLAARSSERSSMKYPGLRLPCGARRLIRALAILFSLVFACVAHPARPSVRPPPYTIATV